MPDDKSPEKYNEIAGYLPQAEWRIADGADPAANNVEFAEMPEGWVALRSSHDPDGPKLLFTPGEWDAFVLGAKDGEFDDLLVDPDEAEPDGTGAVAAGSGGADHELA